MGELRHRLFDSYITHHSTANLNMDPRAMSPIVLGELDRTYGHLLANLGSEARVLDAGCGVGFLLYWLQRKGNFKVSGIDLSPSQVEAARKVLTEVDIRCGDGAQYMRDNVGAFDAVFCFDVLEHLEDDDTCLEWVEAAVKCLKPGGQFICRVPNAANVTGSYMRYNDLTHRRSFTSRSLVQLLEAGGLKDCEILPVKVPHWKGRIRIALESALHRALFRLSCHPPEKIFSYNVSAVGYRRD